MPKRFEVVPYSTFFKLWYALQKALSPEEKAEIFTKLGRTIGKEFDPQGIENIEDFLVHVKDFLTKEWPITDNADLRAVVDENGAVTKIAVKQDSCRMCFANTYYKLHDHGAPSCMFPQVMLGILAKVKNKFHFKNLRYEGVEKGRVGECTMTWNVSA